MSASPTATGRTPSDIVFLVLHDPIKRKWLFKGTTILVSIITLGAIVVVLLFSRSESVVQIQTKEGAIVTFKGNEPTQANFLLPSSAGWINTGITLPTKKRMKVIASGRVHLAINKIVDAARNDEAPEFNWNDPMGREYSVAREVDKKRKRYLIKTDANIGTILGLMVTSKMDKPSFETPYHDDPRLLQITDGRSPESTHHLPDEAATLWLAVNDLIPDLQGEEWQDAYIGDFAKCNPDELHTKLQRCEKIKQAGYRQLWFDDNVGDYLISISFR